MAEAARPLSDLGGWPYVLGKLAMREDLSAGEAGAALGEVLAGEATPSQLAAFIFGLRCKGETVEEMTGLVRAMFEAASPIPVDEERRSRLVDTCGTGGDRSGTINVSTIAAFVVAGAGIPVCKHGNRAQSSSTGSADVLEALGVEINLGPEGVLRCLEDAGVAFCFAPRFHPSMRHAAQTRRELAVPTAFNFLGPLANPARVRRQVVGVSDPAMAHKMVGVLIANGGLRSLVVYGHDGLDELTTTGPSTVVEVRCAEDGAEPRVETYEVDPTALGIARVRRSDLLGGDAAANASAARRVLSGEPGPQREIVLLNSAAGIVAGGAADGLDEALSLARMSIDGGEALKRLERLVDVSTTLQATT
jgi:anthranilate phosphoribosyltransferase